MQPVFVGSEIYRGSGHGPRHPLRVPRVPVVIDLGRAPGWLPAAVWRTSPRARPAALTAFHTPQYVAALERAGGSAPDPDRLPPAAQAVLAAPAERARAWA